MTRGYGRVQIGPVRSLTAPGIRDAIDEAIAGSARRGEPDGIAISSLADALRWRGYPLPKLGEFEMLLYEAGYVIRHVRRGRTLQRRVTRSLAR